MANQPNPTAVLVREFSEPDAQPLAWSDALAILERSEMFWLSTVRRDGRPHVAPLPAMWLAGALHFCTGPAEQKAKNLELNPSCVLTTGTNTYRAGTDIVVEGRAVRVIDAHDLTALARKWKSKIDWVFNVGDGVLLDSEAENSVALVFAVRPVKVLAFAKAPYAQTRFTFRAE